MNRRKYTNLIFIYLLFGSIISSIANEDDSRNYTQTFNITGSLIFVDQAEYDLTGSLSIQSFTDQDQIIYSLEYEAFLPIFQEEGAATFIERRLDKQIVEANNTASQALSIMWDLFRGTNNNTVYSLFRLTEDEIMNDEIKLLTYTTKIESNRNFISPEMNAEIDSYYLVLNEDEISYQLFYDKKHLNLIGFASRIENEIVGSGLILEVIVTIISSTLDLPIIDEIAIRTILLSVAGLLVFFLVSRAGFNRFRQQNQRTIDGGLER